MRPKSKCFYCAYLFNINKSMIRKNGDIIKSDTLQYYKPSDLNEDVIQCTKCNSWLAIKYL